jgi:hypothetical protein
VLEMSLVTLRRQVGQVRSSFSLIFCITSKSPHLLQ